MKKLGDELSRISRSFGASDEASLIARRAAEVQMMFRVALEHIYKEHAPIVLEHVNAVYIKKEEDPRNEGAPRKVLMVYMDDGNFRSDVHSQQHFIMLLLQDRFGECIDEFKAFPSRMGMKEKHPYAEYLAGLQQKTQRRSAAQLSSTQQEDINAWAEKIEDPALRAKFARAAEANIVWDNEGTR